MDNRTLEFILHSIKYDMKGEEHWLEVSLSDGSKIIGSHRVLPGSIILRQPGVPAFYVPLSAIIAIRVHD